MIMPGPLHHEGKVNEYWVKLYEQTNTAVEDFAVLFEFWKGDTTEEENKSRLW